ncbi:helix-turn-helix domain-containing protein [Herbidospora sp. RD11066]
MRGYVRWRDIRAEMVERAGGEEAVAAGKEELLAHVRGHRLAEIRRSRGMSAEQIADRMGVTEERISEIEQGAVSGSDALARYVAALGGRFGQAIYFDDGEIVAIV